MGTPVRDMAAMVRQPARRTGGRKLSLMNLFLYLVLSALSIICLIPFFWMVSTSLKDRASTFQFPPQWIPDHFVWSNYVEALTVVPFDRYALNTFTIEFFVILGQFLSCTLVAYGFARFRFRGREVLFMIMLATQLIPEQVTMIPTFILFSKLGWVDTFLPLTVPAYFGNPFYIFLMRQYFQSIPFDLDEAAKIDGAGAFRILFQILVPLLKPALTIIFVFTFTEVYNDFMGPLIYLSDPDKYTLAIGLSNFVSSFQAEWNYLMAASTVVLFPLLVIYYFAQKHLVGGIANLGIKG
ncbi:carbohydrate ABC transporter permease [Brevibacillus sp. SYP-B805]|uniref:carbohydrate ABC transporter permease n=1 Tax=Brevibacillus sp. SYP-B805 TaxID=1578199 RepID=UPI0013EE1F97|nr:carbohydrate ABC transporter permease [Brevibacillus sp. SYP-B805]NGQ95861.1 carbohydrate ABC transporter permease [Brevibacillus sp. SYP-B805]